RRGAVPVRPGLPRPAHGGALRPPASAGPGRGGAAGGGAHGPHRVRHRLAVLGDAATRPRTADRERGAVGPRRAAAGGGRRTGAARRRRALRRRRARGRPGQPHQPRRDARPGAGADPGGPAHRVGRCAGRVDRGGRAAARLRDRRRRRGRRRAGTCRRRLGGAVRGAAPAAGTVMRLWWHEPFRACQTNLREIDAGLDVERGLDQIEGRGANAWLLSVGGIVSNYPTDRPTQTRNPARAERPSGDLVGDAVAAAHARGIRLLARMDFSKVDRRRAEEHPEWCFVGPDGEWQTYNGLTSVCPSGPYYQREAFAVVDEVLSRYDVDGFFFNWASYNERDYSGRYRGVCRCLSCARAFGAPLPTGPDDPAYPRWRR